MLLVAWRRGWFSGEPTYHGKTVTQWLDGTTLFKEDRNADETGRRHFPLPKPEVVTNDSALRALLHIGSDAVPVLVERLSEPPQWSGPTARLKAWAGWKWDQLWNPGRTIPRPVPAYPSSLQKARKTAAASALLALGTNANAGVPRLLQVWATSPAGARVGADPSPYMALRVAVSGLPERRDEITAGITAAMYHTNASIRRAAAVLTQTFGSESSLWKAMLLKMTKDDDAGVRQSVLWTLAVEDRGDPDVLRLLRATLTEKTNTSRLRVLAAAGLGLAGVRATNSLSLLHEALNDPDRDLQREARGAIRNIEKAIADDKTRTPE